MSGGPGKATAAGTSIAVALAAAPFAVVALAGAVLLRSEAAISYTTDWSGEAMKQWLIAALLAAVVIAGTSAAEARPSLTHVRMTRAQVRAAFRKSVECAHAMYLIHNDMRKTRNVYARGKSPHSVVSPSRVVGKVYLDRLVSKIKACRVGYERLIKSRAMSVIPKDFKRPGHIVDRGKSGILGAGMAAKFLQTRKRLRLKQLDAMMKQLRSKLDDFNAATRAMLRKAESPRTTPRSPDTSPARHFAKLITCMREIGGNLRGMKTYRDRTFGKKPGNYRIAPNRVVGRRNIEQIMGRRGYLATCDQELQKMNRDPMKKYLPSGFLKPHHGAWARMKRGMQRMKLLGRQLRSRRRTMLRITNVMLSQFEKAFGDFASGANYAARHARSQRN